MNHCYRLIWNELHRTWVAVCEFARARGKRSSSAQAPARGPRYRPLCLALALAFAPAAFAGPVAPEVNALPSGGQVTRGSASIGSAGNVMTINQASQRAAYQFKTFDIGAAASVNVNAAAGASGLFRINDNKASQIYGKFNAPGYNAFFTNPNGFYFAPGSQVNVGSLLATTLRMNEDAFMDGNFRLTDPGSGLIDALGSIEAGSVALVGNSINQGGSIVAATVSLVSGNTVAIDLTGNNLIRARIEDPSLSASITNSGDIRATTVTMSAGQARNALQSVVNNSGTVRAVGLSNQGGEIALVADFVTAGGSLDAGGTSGGTVSIQAGDTALVTGTVSAAGNAGKGGRVEVLGSHVGLLDGARIDASGSAGGGSIYAGGGLRGADAALTNARALWFGRHASISADATATGDGGTVVLWSEAVTRAYGDLSARGGISGGDGGFVEVSSRGQLVWDGNADTRAPQGRTGTLLFDPTTIWIASDQASATAAGMVGSDSSVNASVPPTFQASGAPADSLLTISTLLSALGSNNVTVTTASPGSGAGDINVVNDLAWSANKLTLSADRDININAVMTASGTSLLDLVPGTSGSVKVGFNPDGSFKGRVDFPGRTGGILTIGIETYTVINALGVEGSTTGSDLQGMQGNLAGRYALGADINASATVGWNSGAGFLPVGNGFNFTGKFNGLGHTISQLTIDRDTTNFVGLFSKTSSGAIISNVGLEGGSVSGRNSTGALIGDTSGSVRNSYAKAVVSGNSQVGGLVGTQTFGLIDNSYATGNVSGGNSTGGLVGYQFNGTTLSNSYATGSVVGASYTGGLSGQIYAGTISKSYATGNVNGTTRVGGLVGGIDDGGATVSQSFASGNVTSSGAETGGLVGANFDGTVTDSYATGSVSGNAQVGGLVGQTTKGMNNRGSISNSYATGSVSGISNVGGLVGRNVSGAAVTGSYWDTQTSGRLTSAAGTGKTTVQMQTATTFTGWNTSTIWEISDGIYPTLKGLAGQCTGVCWDGGAADSNWFSAANWNGNLLPTATQNVFVKALASPVLFDGTGAYASLKSDSSLTLQGGSLTVDGPTTFASGTTFELKAGTLNFNGATSLGNLTIEGGSAGATGAVSVAGTYSQTGGTWLQIQPTLPAFSAGQFNFNGGTFLRATGGDGTPAAPFRIADVYGLQGMASTGLLNQAFELVDDIDASDTENWNAGEGFRPIGDHANQFTGKFDGDGKTITGLTIDRPSEGGVGLFGFTATGAEIREVGLVGGSVTGAGSVGGLAGSNEGMVTDSYATGAVTANGGWVGGLAGFNGGTVTDSYATGTVSGTFYIGGLVGYNTNSGTVSRSYATGSVTSTGDGTGGLVGISYGTVSHSYASGSVSGTNETGGLVGANWGGTVTDSYATGSVSGNTMSGGLVGDNQATVSNSYATGKVSGTGLIGGLVGVNGGSVSNSFWNRDTSGQSASAGGFGLTNAAMKDPANFTVVGWNPLIWDFEAGRYPTLQGLAGQCGAEACWNGGAGDDNWFSTANWNGNVLPAGWQNIRINDPGRTIVFDNSSTHSFLSLTSNAGFSVNLTGSLTFTDAVNFASGTTFKLQAGSLNFTGATSLGNLTIEGGATATATGALSVAGTYSQTGGTWQQTTLPAFSAGQFNFNGGTFLRVTGGDGTAGNPFLIADVYGLQGMASTSLLAKEFKLVDVIDASVTENWNAGEGFRPIGDSANQFTGKFDGDGKTISDLFIGDAAFAGLFGRTGSTAQIRNVGVVNVNVTGTNGVGGLVGRNEGSVSNSYATGIVNGGDTTNSFTGGLVGHNFGTITDSYASADVNGVKETGGLVGYSGSSGVITNSFFDVDNVEINGATGVVSVGGLYGAQYADWIADKTLNAADYFTQSGGYFMIQSSDDLKEMLGFSTAGVGVKFRLGADLDLSGLDNFYIPQLAVSEFDGAGYRISNFTIDRPDNSAIGFIGRIVSGTVTNFRLDNLSVTGNEYAGGLVAINAGTVSNSSVSGSVTSSTVGLGNAGGLIAWNRPTGTVINSYASGSVTGFNAAGLVQRNDGTISKSYATSDVTATGPTVGGLVASNSGTVSDSFWDKNTSRQSTSAGGTGKITAEMQTAATFTSAGWDTTVWDITNGAYPVLLAPAVPCSFGICWDGGANTFNWFDAANWTGNLLPDSTQSIFIKALASPVLFSGTGAFASLTSDADLTMTSGSLTFTNAVNFASGTLFTLQAGTLAFNGLTALDDLTIAGGSAGGTGAVTVAGAFSQTGGSWQQVQTTLPGFSAGQFNFNGGTFLRAAGGDGTAGTPYLIADLYGLQGMASNSLLNQAFKLVDDIDASDTENWNLGEGFRPIGNSANKFTGGLDGGNHAISHLTIQRSTQDYVGLFGYANNASIQNIELADVAIRGRNYVGGLSGIFSGSGTISNAAVSGTVAGRNLVAGIAGSLSALTITGSHSSADVSGGENIAGIAAQVIGGTISRSYNLGNISIDGSGSGVHTGGIAGDCFSGCLIEQTYNAGTVSGRFNTGGIAGKLFDGDIRNSFNIGAVENDTAPGNANVGGLAGFIDAGSTIATSYSTGSVSGLVSAGGLVGGISGSSVTDSFWDTETSGQALTAGGGTGKTTAEMKTAATFSAAGWDTATIWTLSDGAYPVLQGLPSPFGPGDEVTPTPEVEPKRVVDNVANFVFSSLRSDPETESDGDGNLTGSPFSLVQVTLAGPDAIEQVVTLEVPKGKVMQCQ